jgi:signal peptidase I
MEEQTEQKNKVRQVWDWLWHSDSVWSWLVALALAFISVKFIFFPALSFLLGTGLPLVVVESASMEHPSSLTGGLVGGITGGVIVDEGDFDQWWEEKGEWYEQNGITKEQAQEWSLRTGFDKGDIMVVYGRSNLEVGDVIIFEANTEHPIIHRIVSIEGGVLETKGDNNDGQLVAEKNISEDALIGKAVFRIPKLGWLKLAFVKITDLFEK